MLSPAVLVRSSVGERSTPGDFRPPERRHSSGAEQADYQLDQFSFSDRQQHAQSIPTALELQRTVPDAEKDTVRRYANSLLRINSAIGAAGAAVVAAHSVVLTEVLPHLIDSAPPWLLAYGATVMSFSVLLRFGLSHAITQTSVQEAGLTEENSTSYTRVTRSLERLSALLQKPLALHVSIGKADSGLAYLVDRLFHRDVLALNERVVNRLSDSELDGLVAHEISHADRSFSKFERARAFLHCFSSPAVFWGAALPVYGVLSQGWGGVVAGGVALAASTAVWAGTFLSISALGFFISRQNELKTDLRAVRITGDPEAYLSMLNKVTLPSRLFGGREKLPLFCTHPSYEVRCRLIRQVFGLDGDMGEGERAY
jgi:Zn-dependent protease with chaperone function